VGLTLFQVHLGLKNFGANEVWLLEKGSFGLIRFKFFGQKTTKFGWVLERGEKVPPRFHCGSPGTVFSRAWPLGTQVEAPESGAIWCTRPFDIRGLFQGFRSLWGALFMGGPPLYKSSQRGRSALLSFHG